MRHTTYCTSIVLVLTFANSALAGLELNTPLAPNVGNVLISSNGQRAFCISSGHNLYERGLDDQWQVADLLIPLSSEWRYSDLVEVDDNADTFLVKVTNNSQHSLDYYVTTDGGTSFQLFEFENQINKPQVLDFDNTNHAIVYGLSGNEFMRSEDGGALWSTYTIPVSNVNGFYKDPLVDSLIWAYGNINWGAIEPWLQGGLMKSTNRGETWQQAVDFNSEWATEIVNCSEIVRLSNGKLYATVGGNSVSLIQWLIQSNDNGEHWDLVPDDIGIPRGEFYPYKLLEDSDSPGTLLLSGSAYGMYRSEDFGESWSFINSGLPSRSFDILHIFQNPNGGPLISSVINYGLFESTNHGLTWHGLNSPRVGERAELTTSNGKIFTQQGERLYVLTNPYTGWQEIQTPIKPDTIVRINDPYCLDDGRIAVTYNQHPVSESIHSFGIALTEDLGATWSFQPSTLLSMWDTYWLSLNGGPAIVAKSFDMNNSLYVSSDTGRTWQSHTTPVDFSFENQLATANGRFYITNVSSYELAYTDDLCETWTVLTLPYGNLRSQRFYVHGNDLFVTQCREYPADSLFVFKRDGEAWQKLYGDTASFDFDPIEYFYDQYLLSFVDGVNPAIILQVENYKLLVSRDEGETWASTPLEFPEGYSFLDIPGHFAHPESDKLWFNTSIGPCYLNLSELGLSPVTIHPVLPLTPSLLAYPNPFNSNTQIEFTLQSARDVNLVVYDALGRRVTSLLDKRMTAGAHTINWNATGIASGTYFVQLKSGETNQTRKLVLLK